ncbi:N-acetyltransferase [bacterium]|nr:N-acetyltransferase [bacterium]
MAGTVRVAEAEGGRTLKDFFEVPYIVQGKNPLWVPPLRVQQKELHDEKKHPFYQHAQVRRFTAYLDGAPAGRIAAIWDDNHNTTHKESTCFFGFFESLRDREVTDALFENVERAAREWGADVVRGPFNPSINEDIGLLVDAFDKPPVVMMPYNPDYYPEFVEQQGYGKAMDTLCYYIDHSLLNEKLRRGAEIVRKRTKVTTRHFDKNRFWDEALRIWEVYSRAWEKNWGAVAMTEPEFKHLAKDLKQIFDPDLINLAEDEKGELIGFSLALPNINEALIRIRDGRLFPFGLPKLIRYSRKISSVRVIIMGVLEEYRGRGIDALFHYDNFLVGERKGYHWGEIGWVLETNDMMKRAAELVGAKPYKTYRIYEKTLQ